MNKNNQPGLTPEVIEMLTKHEALITAPKGVWKTWEMQWMYDIYNAYTGEKKVNAGCGACRSSVVNKVRLIHEEYKRAL
jgi:hypothetical protein